MFATAGHMFLSWARSIQSMSVILFLEDSFNVIHPSMPGSSKWSFRSSFPNKSYAYFISPCMLHTPHISSFVWFLKQYFVKSRDYEPAHNTVFFIPLLPFPFSPTYCIVLYCILLSFLGSSSDYKIHGYGNSQL